MAEVTAESALSQEDWDINIYTASYVMGAYWAYGANWDQFTYSGANYDTNVKINYHLKGGIATYAIPLDIAASVIG